MKISLSTSAFLLACLECAGCTFNTTTVRVRDAARVDVESLDGKPLLPAGTNEAKVDEGSFWRPFEKVHYEIQGVREATGAITLHCDECTHQTYPLLDASGATTKTWSWNVAVDPSMVRVSYEQECMEYGSHGFCHAPTPVRLSIPTDNVVEVRRRVEPIRFIGWIAVGFSVLSLGAITAFALSNNKDSLPFAGIAAIPPLGVGAFGLWQILMPTKEQVWTPSRDPQ